MDDRNPQYLSVSDLSIRVEKNFGGERQDLVRKLNFELEPGQRLGCVGETGSGKSLMALSILGLLPPGLQASGSVKLNDTELLNLPDDEWCEIRGRRLAYLPQNTTQALNPVQTIGRQIIEAYQIHHRGENANARERMRELLCRLKLDDGVPLANRYPHQLSGGQRQRAAMAMALAANPDVLIADEPTTSLDQIIQAEVLGHLMQLATEYKFGLILISHDIRLVADLCQLVMVMVGGSLVEIGPVGRVFNGPGHPYTASLLEAAFTDRVRCSSISAPLPQIHPALFGCSCAPGCPIAQEKCRVGDFPQLKSTGSDSKHQVACHFSPDPS